MRIKEQKDLYEEIYRCSNCGSCMGLFPEDRCPMRCKGRGSQMSLMGLLKIAQGLAEGRLSYSAGLADYLFADPLCGSCKQVCPANIDWPNIANAIFEDMVEEGVVPAKVRDVLENIYRTGNAYGKPRKELKKWAEDTPTRQFRPGDEYLLYVGSVGSYDPIGQKAARALANLLSEVELSFGILEDEGCDGNDVRMLGEMGLFQHLMEKNMETFRKMGVKKIIAFDPHAYNALKNYYPIGEFDVVHYTQLVRDLVVNDKLRFSGKLDCKVTYHDPCFLGRYNEVYEQPRKILNSIPGLELVEMDHNREDSFCCGGGNANYITDLIGAKENSPARARVREAYSTGAQILGVACPICQIMMEDALKSEDLEGKMAIKSVAELALDALS